MRKTIYIVLAALGLCLFAGCGSSDKEKVSPLVKQLARRARRRIQRRQAVRQHLRHRFRRVGQYADADQRHGRRGDGRLCARRDSRRGQKRSGRDEEFPDGSDPTFIEHRRRDRSPLAPCAASLDAAHFLCTFHPVSGSGFSPQAARSGYALVTFLSVGLFPTG